MASTLQAADPPAPQEPYSIDFLDFKAAKVHYNRLIDSWTKVASDTERNRCLRFFKGAESDNLRGEGKIKADELYNPVRIIDTNIRREQPQFINYLTQSRRSIILAPEQEQTIDGLENLEQDFTKKARYLGWEVPFIRCIDGAQTHGWDAVELLFDEKYPGNFCFNHVGHNNLIFAIDSEDINNQECVLRREKLTTSQLREFVRVGGWSSDDVETIITRTKNQNSQSGEEVTTEVYKIFFKKDGAIFVSWMSPFCNEYFKVPEPLFLGMRDTTKPPDTSTATPGISDYPKIPETTYPFAIFKYIESENPKITELYGRAQLDESIQEGVSAMSSGLINGILRASNVYGSPAANPANQLPNAAPKALDVVLKNGALFDQPLNFWHLPYPDPSVIQAISAVTAQNQQEQSKVDFAALNRKDSGKTATEIQAATSKSAELSSVQVILLSIFVRQAYSKAWWLYQNRVLQGKIEVEPQLLALFGVVTQQPSAPITLAAPNPLGGQAASYGAPVRLATPRSYIIKSSGDIDVVQRAEDLNKKMQAWPVIANTALATEFLKDILRSSFPEDAARYTNILDQAQVSKETQLEQTIQHLGSVLQSLISMPQVLAIPEVQQQLPQLKQLEANVAGIITNPSHQHTTIPQSTPTP